MRAQIRAKRAARIDSDFGAKLARKYFPGLDLSDYADAWISWRKVDRGGWVREGSYYGEPVGYVLRPGLLDVTIERKHQPVLVSTEAQQSRNCPAGFDYRTPEQQRDDEARRAEPLRVLFREMEPDEAFAVARAKAHRAFVDGQVERDPVVALSGAVIAVLEADPLPTDDLIVDLVRMLAHEARLELGWIDWQGRRLYTAEEQAAYAAAHADDRGAA